MANEVIDNIINSVKPKVDEMERAKRLAEELKKKNLVSIPYLKFKITEQSLETLKIKGVSDDTLKKLSGFKDKDYLSEQEFSEELKKIKTKTESEDRLIWTYVSRQMINFNRQDLFIQHFDIDKKISDVVALQTKLINDRITNLESKLPKRQN
jgi:hypothetical protein